MRTNLKFGIVCLAVLFGTAVSVLADEVGGSADATEVFALIKCHEGKFDALNAVSQLTKEIASGREVYGWSGIGAYPDGHMEGQLVFVRRPFRVSAPTFVQVKDVVWACVTVEKQ